PPLLRSNASVLTHLHHQPEIFASRIALLLQPVGVDEFRGIVVGPFEDCLQEGSLFGHDLTPREASLAHWASAGPSSSFYGCTRTRPDRERLKRFNERDRGTN